MDIVNIEGMGLLFFIAVLASVIIAYGIQFLLSLLSLATGISMTPDLKKKSAELHVAHLTKESDFDDAEDESEDEHISAGAITSGIGLWVLATSSLALFVGTYLGTSLMPLSGQSAIVAAVVVWALFFISLLYIEYKTVHTILGGVINTALSGLRHTTHMIGHAFSPSSSSRVEKMVKKGVRSCYEEADKIIRKNNVDHKLEDYLSRIQHDMPSKRDLKKGLEDFIDRLEVQERTNIDDDEVVRVLDLQLHKTPSVSRDDLKKLKDKLTDTKHKADEKNRKASKILAVIDSIAPVSDDKAREYREQLADILDRTSNEELASDKFYEDLDKMFDDPKEAKDLIIARLKHFDKTTIKEIISDVSGIEQEKYDELVDTVYAYIQDIMNKTADQYRSGYKNVKKIPANVEMKIAAFFDGLEQPDFDYALIKKDIHDILAAPGTAQHVIGERLEKLNKDAVVSMMASHPKVTEHQAEKLADTVLGARDNALQTIRDIKLEARKQYQQSRRKAVIFAETARRNAVMASWWLVLSAVASGAAAVAGALMTVS